jgi:hypothetical protein
VITQGGNYRHSTKAKREFFKKLPGVAKPNLADLIRKISRRYYAISIKASDLYAVEERFHRMMHNGPSWRAREKNGISGRLIEAMTVKIANDQEIQCVSLHMAIGATRIGSWSSLHSRGCAVHRAMDEILEILLEPDKVQQGAPVSKPYEQVEVAGLAAFTSRQGPEDTHVAGSMAARQSQDLLPVSL